MTQYVDISFDCLPLRSVGRFDIPVDASPEYQALCERIKHAADKHGLHNTYYLHNAECTFHLANHPEQGTIEFRFEGTVLTDPEDRTTVRCDLQAELKQETCDWLAEPIVAWFAETVNEAVRIEFDRYIMAGDLTRTVDRLERVRAESDDHGGFMGMGL